jgi:ribonuclease M5
MLNCTPAIVVEGVYDKIRLSSLVDTLIIPTDGFAVFKDKEKIQLLRKLAEHRGIVILTDSDGAGFLIRNRLKQQITKGQIYHAYIPDVMGKEKRKNAPSAEGKLGVEGMTTDVLAKALSDAGVLCTTPPTPKAVITKADFMKWGLTGGERSSHRRQALQKQLNLPERMTANTLLEVLSRLYSYEEIETIINTLL